MLFIFISVTRPSLGRQRNCKLNIISFCRLAVRLPRERDPTRQLLVVIVVVAGFARPGRRLTNRLPHAPSCTSITVLLPNYLRQVHGPRSVSKVRVVYPTIRVPSADHLRPRPDTLRRRGNRRRQQGKRTRNARDTDTFLFSKRTVFITRFTLLTGPLRSGWSRQLALGLPFAVIKKGNCREATTRRRLP